MHSEDALKAVFEQYGLPSTDAVLDRFAAYRALLEKARTRFNLIGPLSHDAVTKELFCDSVMSLALQQPPQSPILDVGSGAGFPGIPIKLVYPESKLVLVEPREKRYRFLGQVIRGLGLENVERYRDRIEALELEPFGLTCSKAVFAPARWLDVAAPRTRSGGHVSVLCAEDAWDATCLETAKRLGLEVVKTLRYRWKDDAPQRLAVLLEAS